MPCHALHYHGQGVDTPRVLLNHGHVTRSSGVDIDTAAIRDVTYTLKSDSYSLNPKV